MRKFQCRTSTRRFSIPSRMSSSAYKNTEKPPGCRIMQPYSYGATSAFRIPSTHWARGESSVSAQFNYRNSSYHLSMLICMSGNLSGTTLTPLSTRMLTCRPWKADPRTLLAVRGRPLKVEHNYGFVIKTLTDLFRRQDLVNYHVDRLLALIPVKRSDAPKLRLLEDNVQFHDGTLESLVVSPD